MATFSARDHIVTGRGTIIARALQFIIALTVAGLAAYGLVFLHFPGLVLNMFTACITVIGCIYLLLSTTLFVKIYNYWAALAFDIFGFAFWITSFALLVSQIRPFYLDNYYYDGCDWIYYGTCYYKRDLEKMGIEERATTTFFTYRNSMGAIAALAGLEMLLFMATFVAITIFIADHRRHGGHALFSCQAASRMRQQNKKDLEMKPASKGVQQSAAAFQQQPAVPGTYTAPNPPPPASVNSARTQPNPANSTNN